MVANRFSLAKQLVKEQYEELMQNGLLFLQIFPEMVQEANIVAAFKRRGAERNKSVTRYELDERTKSIG